MPEPLTRDTVAHVARLAMLELSEDELETFTGQLGAVLEHARDVEALDIGADVPPTAHPYPLVNVLRPDVVADAEAVGVAVAENLGYRQLNAWWRIVGLYRWATQKEGGWGQMKRKGNWQAGR